MIMEPYFELTVPDRRPDGHLRAAVFDFDGTVSTLRCGWEQIMQPLMLEYLSPDEQPSPDLVAEVDRYIDESTGIQTIYQMQWLSEQAEKRTGILRDPWWYKAEYNRRLMESVDIKKQAVACGAASPDRYVISGAPEFLKALKERGIALYLASGTDDADVKKEAALLGAAEYFTEIKGAPEGKALCSKEAVLNMLFEEKSFAGSELLVVGDGKVEIALGRRLGAFTIGAATDERTRRGINPVKRGRLLKAGADVIVGDFTALDKLLGWIDRRNP